MPLLVRILTADVKGAGTDAHIEALLEGPRGSSGWQPLLGGHDTFERGQVGAAGAARVGRGAAALDPT